MKLTKLPSIYIALSHKKFFVDKFYRPHPKDGEGNVFTSVFRSQRGGGTPSPFNNTSTGPMSFLIGTPSSSHISSTGPMSFLGGSTVPYGVPLLSSTGWGYPGEDRNLGTPGQDRDGVPPARTGLDTPLPGKDGGTPGQDRMGVPPWSGLDGMPPPHPSQDSPE